MIFNNVLQLFHPAFNILTSLNSIQISTSVQTSLAGLKASTIQLMGIIAGARHILAGTGEAHNVLTKQATTLLDGNSCDLFVIPNPSTGPLTVNLPSSPVPPPAPVLSSAPVMPSPPAITSSSNKMTFEFWDKGKGLGVQSLGLENFEKIDKI
ncbi:hypothetical protein EDD22DRAFT_957635 [Suillus occidentalis]|nr:hypothetical protein EDD22DRAFT_957635 [Suillus occidentalis]